MEDSLMSVLNSKRSQGMDQRQALIDQLIKNAVTMRGGNADTPIDWNSLGTDQQVNPVNINPLAGLPLVGPQEAEASDGEQMPRTDWRELLTRILMLGYKQ